MTSWTDRSFEWLQEQIKAHPEMSKAELRKWCSKHYPFSERKGWAYKAWLKAMRAYFNPKPTSAPFERNQPSSDELEQAGQARLLP